MSQVIKERGRVFMSERYPGGFLGQFQSSAGGSKLV